MKFVLQVPEIQKILQSSVTSFFFNDRGAEVQTTVEGLLQVILHQLLFLYPDVIPPVLQL